MSTRSAILIATALLVGCSTAGSGPSSIPVDHRPSLTSAARPHFGGQPIQHVIIIIQENRSFNDLFMGFPGANTATSGLDHNGAVVQLQPVSLADPHDLCHEHKCFVKAYDGGKMDGFDLYDTPNQPATFPYAYVPKDETAPYWTLASDYTLADDMFQSNTGPSYPAHQYLISGQSDLVADNPNSPSRTDAWGCDSPKGTTTAIIQPNGKLKTGPYPCFDYETLGDLMDDQRISWNYYATSLTEAGGIWSAYDAIKHIRFGRDWHQNVVSPETQFLSDVANGDLAQVTWITPSKKNSDHAGSGSESGPQWVASVVNAVGRSRFWNSTAIFIVWDDWGGWYDNVPPQQLDEMGLGFRVPMIVVSPYAKNGYVSHVQHEFGSILKFTEETLGIPSLGQTDQRADDLSDCFYFGRAPTRFKPLKTTMRPADFIYQPQTGEAPDD
jgi:phospholipase C